MILIMTMMMTKVVVMITDNREYDDGGDDN